MTKRTKLTAAELLAELNAEPGFVARREQAEGELRLREAEYRLAEAPLVDELQAAGFPVQSVWDLVNTPGSYPKALPILLAHLPRTYPSPVREGIARALAVPETSRLGWDVVTRLYRQEQDERVKIGMAAAVAAAADASVMDDVLDLVRDRAQGGSRVLLLGVLERSRDSRVRGILRELADDPDLSEETNVILRRLNRGSH